MDYIRPAEAHAAAKKNEDLFMAVEEVIRSAYRLQTANHVIVLTSDGEGGCSAFTPPIRHNYPLSGRETSRSDAVGPTKLLKEGRPFLAGIGKR